MMKTNSRWIAGLIAAASLALASSAAMAQGMGGGMMGEQGGGNPQMEMQQLQQRLAETQQQAIENNPRLQEQGDALENLVLDKMEDAGYQPRQDLETLEAAEEQLRDPDLSAEERQELIQSEDVQRAQMNLQEAQQSVAGDPEVQEAQEALRDDLMAAMREENPEVESMIERMQTLQQQMMQQGGQGGMPQQAPQQ